MKKIYFLSFFLLMIFFAGEIQAQKIAPVSYYPMLSWDTSPYKSFRYTRPNAAWEWINFRMLFPNGYEPGASDGKKYPLIIMLHGAGESGRMEWNNTTKTNSPYPSGDPRIDNNDHQLLFGGKEHLNAVTSGRFPGFVVFPQNFYGTWVDNKGEASRPIHRDLQKVTELVEALIAQYNVDPSRVYIHGLSNGGAGTWYAAYARPDLFAAALPMSAPGDPAMAEQLAQVPLWVFQGELDTNPRPASTLQTVNAVKNAGGNVRYTEYTNTAHNTWNRAYAERDFFEWMLLHKKADPNQPNREPLVNAGEDKMITLPTNTTTFTADARDSDGTIANYLWVKVSGPSASMAGITTSKLSLSNLVEGSYTFKVTVSDDKGATASDEVNLVVNPQAPANQVPVVNAGSDKTLTLPNNQIVLSGGATDSDGRLVAFLWEKVSGPSVTMTGQNTANVGLADLVEGVYVFRFSATDDKGATASDEMTLTVNAGTVPTNQAPTVNAGKDRSISLPQNTATITAIATDPDGTIASYLWEKVSGPAVTMANTTTEALSLSNLLEGSYTFKVTVKDDKGATASDEVVLTVIPQSTASCQSLALNGSNMLSLSSSIILSGDFTIEYWAKLSGSITNADAPVSGGSSQYINYYQAQARLYSKGATGGNDPVVSSHKTVADQWTHYAFVRQGTSMKVYINGVEDTGAKATNQWTGSFTINNLGQGAGYLAGELDELRIWSTARTASNILNNYNRKVAVTSAGLKAYFTFDETSGVVKDVSGNGYDSQNLVAGISRTSSTAPLTDCGVVTNKPPTVNAGLDKTITLPTNTATFTATASDPDGTIASYSWVKVSGPTATLSGTTTATLSLSNLLEGSYTFKVTVKDDKGATASDEVNLTVQKAPVVGSALRINAAGGSVTAANGEVFAADQHFTGGRTKTYYMDVTTPSGVAKSGIYHTERFGNFTYSIPVASGTYQLKLHFAEVYWTNAGKRVFSVHAEGMPVLVDYDIFADVGYAKAVVKEFEVTVTDGKMDLSFITSVDNAKISAIEVVEKGSSTNQAFAANSVSSSFSAAPENKVTVYPNTFDDQVKVRIDSEEKEGVYEISVYDFQGRFVHKEQMTIHSASAREYLLDLSGLRMPSGAYFIQVRGKNDSFREVVKVLKK